MEEKIEIYDRFKCTGDKCKYTCCTGWDIEVDKETYNFWENEKPQYIKKVKKKSKDEYFIKKKIMDYCPFLDEIGLCNIIKENDDTIIPSGCQSFPRIENKIGENTEKSLNLACLEVLHLISKIDGKINLPNLINLKLRSSVDSFIKNEDIPLDRKLVLSFKLANDYLDGEEVDKEALKRLNENYDEVEWDRLEGLMELNTFFLDIIENYKRVPLFKNLLGKLQTFRKKEDLEYLSFKWEEFKNKFNKYNAFLENVIRCKIYSNCSYEEDYEVVLSLQLVILEYLFFKFALFLSWFSEGNDVVDGELLKEYIMAFSRIIGNNREAMIDFIEEEYGDSLLDFEYLEGLLLF